MENSTTILKALPEYRRILTVNLIIDFATLLILALLIIQFIRRKHHRLDLNLFFQMCLCDTLMVLVTMVFQLLPAFWVVDNDNSAPLIIIMDFLGPIVDQIFSVILLAQWLIYVEYTLHQSRDLIRRRYPTALALFKIYIAVLITGVICAFWIDLPGYLLVFYYGLIFILYRGVLLFYIIASYVVLFMEKKRNRIPAYIRLTPTTLCMLVGFSIELLFSESFWSKYQVLPLFFAIGLLFADFYLYRRLNNIDPQTGFYNRHYLSSLASFAKKHNLRGATIISFKVSRGNDIVVAVLKSWLPEQCKAITMGDGLYLLVSDAVKDSVSQRFISLVSQNLKDKGIPVEASYETDRDRFMADMLQKY